MGTNLNASNIIRMNAADDINVEGAFVDAGDLLHATAGNNINVLTGISSQTGGSKHKEGFIGLEFADGGKINTANYHSVKDQLTTTTSIGSSLNSGGNVVLDAGQDVNIIGSSVSAMDEGFSFFSRHHLGWALGYRAAIHSWGLGLHRQ